MCGSNGSNSNCCCCPNAVEKICGNLMGPLTNFPVWTAPTVNDYFQGTFEIFNAGPAGNITSNVIPDTSEPITPGNSISASINNPTTFTVTVDSGTHGKFCITLYKRVFG
jgi:hypothetical protein